MKKRPLVLSAAFALIALMPAGPALAEAVGPQARLLAQEAVQLHGGIGITEEYGVSHCLRRSMVDEQLFGGVRSHLQQFARSLRGR